MFFVGRIFFEKVIAVESKSTKKITNQLNIEPRFTKIALRSSFGVVFVEQERPRASKSVPRASQERPKARQERPKSGKKGPGRLNLVASGCIWWWIGGLGEAGGEGGER